MTNRLYVAGFPYTLTEQELKDSFSKAGVVVSAKIINERETGRSRGFGFVEMSTEEEAVAAIQMWNETNMGGRRLVVNAARPMEPRQRQDRNDGGDGNDRGFRRDRGVSDGRYGS